MLSHTKHLHSCCNLLLFLVSFQHFTPVVVTQTASSVKKVSSAAGGGGGGGGASGGAINNKKTNGNGGNGPIRRSPTAEQPSNGAQQPANAAAAGKGKSPGSASGGKEKSALLTSKCILRTITAFLASNKRNSYNAQLRAKQMSRRRRQRKMDELSGKINPKMLEQLRKKTKFTK